jgi:hypothetical protein
MPLLSRCFVRSALVCLAVGFTIGGLILASKGGAADPRFWDWLPEHIILLLFGWLVQLTLGVAYWILPRMNLADRGRQRWAWAACVASQIGIGLLLLSLLRLWIPVAGDFFVLAVFVQAAAVVFFVVHAWPRVHAAIVRAAQDTKGPT